MILDVWMEGVWAPVGSLERSADKSLTFRYAADVPPKGRVSMSMPIRSAPYGDAAARAFFGNLLFEGQGLERAAASRGLDADDIVGLLAHFGADCAGAISVTPAGSGPGKRPGIFPEDYEEIAPARMLEIVRSLHFYGKLPEGERPSALVAGVQPKIALVAWDGKFYRPRDGSRAPTTHILKVSPRDDLDIARREVALLSLARACGLETADCTFLEFEDPQTCAKIGTILSQRFDREVDRDEVRRIHAEDFCQALGLSRHLKYERSGVLEEHRFDMAAIGRLAGETGAPARFQLGFLRQTLFNLAVGNTDNHGKNASILYRNLHGDLAPLYDVVPVTMDERPTHQLSFSLGEASYAEDLSIGEIGEAMTELGIRRPRFSKMCLPLLEAVARGIGQLEEQGGKSLVDGVAAQLEVVADALGLDLGLPERDFFPRNLRDRKVAVGGWG